MTADEAADDDDAENFGQVSGEVLDAAVSEDRVYVHDKAIITAGDNITVTPEDTDNTLTIASSGVPVQDDGTEIDDAPEHVNYSGAGVTVTQDGAGVEVAIPGGGGGGGSTDTQRGESVTFQVGSGTVNATAVVLSPLTAAPIAVTYPATGGGDAEILDEGDNADGFEILKGGVYEMTLEIPVTSSGDRATPTGFVFNYADAPATATPIGTFSSDYLRFSGTTTLIIHGKLTVASDNTQVKLVTRNAYPAFDASSDGNYTVAVNSKLTLFRLGEKGDKGDAGTGSGATNLSVANRDADSLDIASDTGTDATIESSTTTAAGLESAAHHVKVEGVEAGSTADQTGPQIKTAYEGESDTNAFTDANQTKLLAIEADADVTDAKRTSTRLTRPHW